MQSNANRIVALVGAGLFAAVVALVVGSGGSGGGGGGAPAATTPATDTQTQQEADVQTTGDSGGSSVEKDMSLDEFEALLDAYDAGGETGQDARDAASSPDVPATNVVYQQVAERGFGDVEVQADFALDGSYADLHALDAASTERYPSYAITYVSSQDVLWAVYVNEGCYLAVPIGTVGGEAFARQIILTETDVITQYDGSKNQFSDFAITDIADATCVKVDRIDRATLDSYAPAQLEAL